MTDCKHVLCPMSTVLSVGWDYKSNQFTPKPAILSIFFTPTPDDVTRLVSAVFRCCCYYYYYYYYHYCYNNNNNNYYYYYYYYYY